MNTTKMRLAWYLALALSGTTTAGATTLPLYDSTSDPGGFSQGVQGGGWIANEFSTGANCPTGCKLEKVTLVLNADFVTLTDTSNLKLEITSDGGSLPGPVTIAVLENPSSIGVGRDLAMFTPSVETILDHDTEYWVKLSSLLDPFAGSEVNWEYTLFGTGGWAFSEPGFGELSGSEGPYLMSVEATPQAAVPAPTALWLMAPMLAGLAVRANKKS